MPVHNLPIEHSIFYNLRMHKDILRFIEAGESPDPVYNIEKIMIFLLQNLHRLLKFIIKNYITFTEKEKVREEEKEDNHHHQT